MLRLVYTQFACSAKASSYSICLITIIIKLNLRVLVNSEIEKINSNTKSKPLYQPNTNLEQISDLLIYKGGHC